MRRTSNILALAAAAAFALPAIIHAQSITHVVKQKGPPRAAKLIEPPPANPQGGVLHDTLWITDDQVYDVGNGNAWSGNGAFGVLYDLRLADDFEVPAGGYVVTEITADFVALSGTPPAHGAWVYFYHDVSGKPAETPFLGTLVSSVTTTPFTDTVFGYAGVRITLSNLAAHLPPGTHWVNVQPYDVSASGDWYYQVRDWDAMIGSDTHVRDGCINGGYGHTEWRSTGDDGYGAGTAAMKIAGFPGDIPGYERNGLLVAAGERDSELCAEALIEDGRPDYLVLSLPQWVEFFQRSRIKLGNIILDLDAENLWLSNAEYRFDSLVQGVLTSHTNEVFDGLDGSGTQIRLADPEPYFSPRRPPRWTLGDAASVALETQYREVVEVIPGGAAASGDPLAAGFRMYLRSVENRVSGFQVDVEPYGLRDDGFFRECDLLVTESNYPGAYWNTCDGMIYTANGTPLGMNGGMLQRQAVEVYTGLPAVDDDRLVESQLVWTEGFDVYETDSGMHGQGAWKGWDNDPAFDAFVTDAQARGIPHSVDVAATSDLVHELQWSTAGRWQFTAWQYIPGDFSSDNGAPFDPGTYFLLLNTYNDGGPYHWSVQFIFDSNDGMLKANHGDGQNTIDVPYFTDTWVRIRAIIDLDNDWVQVYYDEALLAEYSWTGGIYGDGGGALNIAAADLFANGSTTVYYDDLSLRRSP